jgi:hypothetical protein
MFCQFENRNLLMFHLYNSLPVPQLFRYFFLLTAALSIGNSATAEFILERHADAQFPARDSALGIEHNGSLWMMGGYTNFFGYPAQRLNDIWQSSDGFNWVNTQPVSSVWQPRNLPFGFSLGGSMWVMGGTDGHAMFDDIWSSEDGANWQLHNSASHFSARAGAFSTTFNNQMFVMGGASDLAGHALNDVWRSSNGNDWELLSTSANWAPRSFGSLVTFNGKMWLLGGGVYDQNQANNNAGNYNDVWSSEDGVNSQVWTITAIPEPSSLFLLTGPCLVLVAVSIRRFRLGPTTATKKVECKLALALFEKTVPQ